MECYKQAISWHMAFSQHLKHFKEGKDEILNTKFKPGHQQETTPTAGDNFFFFVKWNTTSKSCFGRPRKNKENDQNNYQNVRSPKIQKHNFNTVQYPNPPPKKLQISSQKNKNRTVINQLPAQKPTLKTHRKQQNSMTEQEKSANL